ncbi:methyltransferase domain-containing protein [Dehalococcoidia bacterium]|nr:methyltransferase domain-containing protein [Dehalococcoidia bacterium]
MVEKHKSYPTVANSPRLRKVAKLAMKHKKYASVVLDIGCGDGNFTAHLGKLLQSQEIIGIDISLNDALALDRSIKQGYITKGFCLDVAKDPLPFPNDVVDFIFAGEIIEHLIDPDHLLDEIYRVLKPDEGCAIITTPNLAAWFNRLALVFGFQPFLTEGSFRYPWIGKWVKFGESGGGHIRVFTKKAFEELLRLHGFQVIGIYGGNAAEPIYTPLPYVLRLLDTISEVITPIAGTIIAVLKKPLLSPLSTSLQSR